MKALDIGVKVVGINADTGDDVVPATPQHLLMSFVFTCDGPWINALG